MLTGFGRGGSGGRRGGIYIIQPPNFSVDPSKSTVTVVGGATSVASGSLRTLRLQLKDTNGTNVSTASGLTIAATKTGGTSTGTLSSITDNGDGTLDWTYTGIVSGTAQTLGATINGVSVSTTLPTLSVTPGPISAVTSTLAISSATAVVGDAAVTITMTGKDAAGNLAPTGSPTVAFQETTIGIGQSITSIGSTVADGNNVYHAAVSPIAAGTAVSLGATLDSVPSTNTVNFTVTAAVSAWLTMDPDTFATLQTLKGWPNWYVDAVWGTATLESPITGYNGRTKAIRINFADQSGQINALRCHDYSPSELNIGFASAVSEVWIELYSEFDPTFATTVPAGWGCGSGVQNAYKFVHFRRNSAQAVECVVGNPDATSLDVNMIEGGEFTAGIPASIFDGTIKRHRIHVKMGAGGLVKWEIDGTLRVNRTALPMANNTIYGMCLGRNDNHGPDHNMYVRHHLLYVHNSDPGWPGVLGATMSVSIKRGPRLAVVTSLTSASSPYTVLASDELILADTTSGAITINLLDPTVAANKHTLTVILIGTSTTNAVTLSTASGVIGVGGAATWGLKVPGAALRFTPDGTNYQVDTVL